MNINEFIKKNKDYIIEKYNLPDKSVIYFICEEDGEIIYIGTATNLQTRFKVQSTRIEFYHKPVFFFLHPIEKCKELERILIKQIKPKYNIQWTNRNNNNHRKKYDKYAKCKDTWNSKLKKTFKLKKEIIKFMEEKDVNPTGLAELVGVSRQRIHQVLKDKRTLHDKTIKMFEKALKITLD